MRTVAFCEIEPYCRKVLAKHWPDVPVHTDIRQLDGSQYAGTVDLVCGGYPCQPFSTAGKQRGEEDPRHLWPEMHRVIREARPRWVVAENVRGHVSLGFDTVAAQLEDDGFTVWPFIVPACSLGAPHKRERLWIVAHAPFRDDPGIGGAVHGQNGRQKRQLGTQPSGPSSKPLVMADTECERLQGRDEQRPEPPAVIAAESDRDCRRSKFGTAWWREPGLDRVAYGVPNQMERMRALGNAVVPQIPELIGRAILAYERQRAAA